MRAEWAEGMRDGQHQIGRDSRDKQSLCWDPSGRGFRSGDTTTAPSPALSTAPNTQKTINE